MQQEAPEQNQRQDGQHEMMGFNRRGTDSITRLRVIDSKVQRRVAEPHG